MAHAWPLICIVLTACAKMPEPSPQSADVPVPTISHGDLPIAQEPLSANDGLHYSVPPLSPESAFLLLNCNKDPVSGGCAPIMGSPSTAQIDNASCMLDILRATAGIEDINTGVSRGKNLEIQFSYKGPSRSQNVLRYEVIPIRDSFSYGAVDRHSVEPSNITDGLTKRWFEECRAVEQAIGIP